MTLTLLTSLAVLAAVDPDAETEQAQAHDTWSDNARFFVGARGGAGFVPGGNGPSPTFGVEMGVSNKKGVGFGLHLLGATNTEQIDFLGIPKATMAFGGEVDLRIYIQTVEPLTLYPCFSLGFLTGPAETTGKNVVLPLLNLGFGGRVRFGSVYASLELGLASFHIPYVSISLGFETKRRAEAQEEEHRASEKRPEQPVVPPPPPPPPASSRATPTWAAPSAW
jgi:hypothetical protein